MKNEEEHFVGIAYGFFFYAGKRSILEVLPRIRKGTKTPPELTLDLIEGLNNLDTANDSALVDIVEQAKQHHMSHVLKANLPEVGNRRTANFLGNIMSGIYRELYDKSEPFNSGIVYKRGDKYVFRRE